MAICSTDHGMGYRVLAADTSDEGATALGLTAIRGTLNWAAIRPTFSEQSSSNAMTPWQGVTGTKIDRCETLLAGSALNIAVSCLVSWHMRWMYGQSDHESLCHFRQNKWSLPPSWPRRRPSTSLATREDFLMAPMPAESPVSLSISAHGGCAHRRYPPKSGIMSVVALRRGR